MHTRTSKGKIIMPWAKILRSGQVTFPKEVREKLGLKEGDIVDFEIREAMVIMRPKLLIDKGEAMKIFSQAFERLRSGVKEGIDQKTLDGLMEEAVQGNPKPKISK
jgi:AbrB family looped-hinge helix DNA binding protein